MMKSEKFWRSLLLLACLQEMPAQVVVTPVSSKLELRSIIGEDDLSDHSNQGATLDPFGGSVSTTGETMSLTSNGSANWSDSSQLLVSLGILRPDNGAERQSFFGGGTFCYTFTIDIPATIAVDYDMVGTSNSQNQSKSLYWWGMGGFDITVGVGNSPTFLRFPGGGPLEAGDTSPYSIGGTHLAELPAGTHTVIITGSNNATGNLAGDRTMTGTFSVQIGAEPEVRELGAASLTVQTSMADLTFTGTPRVDSWKLWSGPLPDQFTVDLTEEAILSETASGEYCFSFAIDEEDARRFFRVED